MSLTPDSSPHDFDAQWWEHHYQDVAAGPAGPPSIHRVAEMAGDTPGTVLDAGCGTGADAAWQPPQRYDLVVSQYVHPDMPFGDLVTRLAHAVASGGTLLIVGHDHADSHAAAHAPQPASIGPVSVIRALDPSQWEVTVAETRVRDVTHGSSQFTIADMVVKAHRKPASVPDAIIAR